MLSGLGDLSSEGVEEVQGVEHDPAFPSVRVRQGGHLHRARFGEGDTLEGNGNAQDVVGEALDAVGLVIEDELLAVDGEPGVDPGEQGVPEHFGEPFRADEAAEHLFEGMRGPVGEGEELPLGVTTPLVTMAWMGGEVGEGADGLDGGDHARDRLGMPEPWA